MNILRPFIESAVADVIAEHPRYFTPRGQEKAQAAIVRKIMAALRGGDDEKPAEEAAPPAHEPFIIAEPDTAQARGYINLRRISGGVEARRTSDKKIVVNREAHCEAVAALADLPPRSEWLFLTAREQVRAWMDFFRAMMPDAARRPIAESRNGQTGILMPYPFPPSKAGRIYRAQEQREEDAA